jgi:hypothetical protein
MNRCGCLGGPPLCIDGSPRSAAPVVSWPSRLSLIPVYVVLVHGRLRVMLPGVLLLADAVYQLDFERGPISQTRTSLFMQANTLTPQSFEVVGEVYEIILFMSEVQQTILIFC